MADQQRINTGMRLLGTTVEALDEAAERMGGKSRAFVVEVLTALFADKLDASTRVPISMLPPDTRAKRKPKVKGGDE